MRALVLVSKQILSVVECVYSLKLTIRLKKEIMKLFAEADEEKREEEQSHVENDGES